MIIVSFRQPNVLIVSAATYEKLRELDITDTTWTTPTMNVAPILEEYRPPKKRGRYWESPKGYRGKRH